MKKSLIAGAAAALLMCACSGKHGWEISGDIASVAAGTKIAVEGFNGEHSRWFVIDSVTAGKDGKFQYHSDAPLEYPELIRLSVPGQGSIVVPVDSVDHVTVTAPGFGGGHVLEGTQAARAITQVDKAIAEAITRCGVQDAPADSAMRATLVNYIIADSSAIVSYYIINKAIGNRLIFTPEADRRIYGAAAQAFARTAPDDPRGLALRAVYLSTRQNTAPAQETSYDVPQAGLLDIVRYDNNGQSQSLAELAAKGNVLLLNFTQYAADYSPAYNVMLNDLYSQYRDRGFEIYQISFDPDEVFWKETARNLPWVTVYNSAAEGIAPLSSYNVGGFPVTFIIDRQGDLRERIDDPAKLSQSVKKYF